MNLQEHRPVIHAKSKKKKHCMARKSSVAIRQFENQQRADVSNIIAT
jgi:hypothetical protein